MGEVLLLSVVQGVAEFLPVSSSGHLVLIRSLLGLGDVGLRLDVFLHVGTLASVLAFYFATVARLAKGFFSCDAADRAASWSMAGMVLLSAVPAGVVGLLLQDWIESTLAAPRVVGAALVFTGVVLTATRFMPRGDSGMSPFRALLMGLAQAVAVLPGVSRSGMTLAAARAAKVDAEKAAEFSFLMSAPPIVGAALLEAVSGVGGSGGGAAEVPWGLCALGAVLSAVVGYFALRFLLVSLKSRWFWLFGPYCLLAGTAALVAG